MNDEESNQSGLSGLVRQPEYGGVTHGVYGVHGKSEDRVACNIPGHLFRDYVPKGKVTRIKPTSMPYRQDEKRERRKRGEPLYTSAVLLVQPYVRCQRTCAIQHPAHLQ